MSNTNRLKERLAEAARYALLRRLAPAIRHSMGGALQPISMVVALLEKRLQAPVPDLVVLGKNCSSIKTLSLEAASTCVGLMSWLAPNDNERVRINKGIADSVELLTTEISFRGFDLVNETASVDAEVPQSILRSVFVASLIALIDAAHSPGKVLLTARVVDGEVLLVIAITAFDGESAPASLLAYRELDWDDVQSLAAAEGVSLERADNLVKLRYRTAVVE